MEWENLDGSCFSPSGGGSGGGDGGGLAGYYNSKKKDELDGTYQLAASFCSDEPLIGLKLGKRTYFENSCSKDANITSSVSGSPVESVSAEKKVKTYCQSQSQSTSVSRCQVEGCNLDLSAAKEYHRKHRVCESHSKSPKVIVAGIERRFCQQCSRFHSMSEFDEQKRSCRRRLSDHNARRRKPQHDPTWFNSPTQYSSLYSTDSIDVLSRATGSFQLSHVPNIPKLAHNGLTGYSGTTAMIFDQDFKEPLASHVDAFDLRRALSLLSNNSCEPYSIAREYCPMRSTSPTMVQHVVPPSSPLSSHEYRDANQQPFDPWIHARTTSTTNNHFQEFQIFKPSYENSFLFHPNS